MPHNVTYRADDGSLRQCLIIDPHRPREDSHRTDVKTTSVEWIESVYSATDVESGSLINVQPMPGAWSQVSTYCPPVLVEEPRPFRLKGIGW